MPPSLIADSGASLYVIEAPQDGFDEIDRFFNRARDGEGPDFADIDERADADPGSKETTAQGAPWIGEQVLRLVLRHALSQKVMVLIGHADFQVAEGIPTETTLFNPDSPGHPARTDGGAVGFRLKVTATTGKTGRNCKLDWNAEKLIDVVSKDKKVRRDVERIGGATQVLPFGGAIVVRHPIGNGREYVLLLRVITLQEP